MNSSARFVLLPYALFAFSLGFAWFMMAPLVPDLVVRLSAPLGAILFLISLYGYAMIVGSMPAGFWVARQGPTQPLRLSIALTVIGLIIRTVASHYSLFLFGQILAALAYPFLIAPIGAILRQSGIVKTRMATGIVIGTLFFGMSVGSLVAPHLPPNTVLWIAVILNLVIGVWLWQASSRITYQPQPQLGAVKVVVTSWWVIGFVVSSISVMFGSISTTALGHLHVVNAASLGGLLSSLTFLGSAVGAALFGWIGQQQNDTKGLKRYLGIFTLIFLMGSGFLLTGVLSPTTIALDVVFFIFGVVSNGWYALALESAATAAQNAGSAGLATAGYSMASNVGVAIVPVLLGPLVVQNANAWLVILGIMALIAAIVPFVAKSLTSSPTDQRIA